MRRGQLTFFPTATGKQTGSRLNSELQTPKVFASEESSPAAMGKLSKAFSIRTAWEVSDCQSCDGHPPRYSRLLVDSFATRLISCIVSRLR